MKNTFNLQLENVTVPVEGINISIGKLSVDVSLDLAETETKGYLDVLIALVSNLK